MTPSQFNAYWEGWHWRQEREYDKLAFLGTVVISPWASKSKRVKPSDLLGREMGTSRLPSFRPPLTEKEKRLLKKRRGRDASLGD